MSVGAYILGDRAIEPTGSPETLQSFADPAHNVGRQADILATGYRVGIPNMQLVAPSSSAPYLIQPLSFSRQGITNSPHPLTRFPSSSLPLARGYKHKHKKRSDLSI